MTSNVRLSLALLLLVPQIVKLALFPNYPGFDDSFIHLRIAENLADGKGWGLNAHEPINVSSSPLFTVLLAAAHAAGMPLLPFGMLLSAVSTALATLTIFALVRDHDRGRTRHALFAAMLFACNAHIWRWNGTVMEVSLACAVMGAAGIAFDRTSRGSARWAFIFGVALSCAALLRFELLLLVPAALVALLGQARRDFANRVAVLRFSAAGFVPLIAVWLAACEIQFGSMVPTTFLSKATSSHWFNLATARSIVLILGSSFVVFGAWTLALCRGVPLTRTVAGLAAGLRRSLFWITFAILCIGFYVFRVDEFQSAARYLHPVIFALCVTAGLVLTQLEDHGATPRATLPMGAAVAGNLILMLALTQLSIAPPLRSFKENYWQASRAAADFIAERSTRPTTVVFATSDVGMLAYYSRDRYRVLDAPGLTIPGMAGSDAHTIRQSVRPDFIVEHYGSDAPTEFGAEFSRVLSTPFIAAGVVSSRPLFYLNVYQRMDRTDRGVVH